MFETVHSMSRALDSVRREKSEEHGGLVSAFALHKSKCVEGKGKYLLRDGVCVTLQQPA